MRPALNKFVRDWLGDNPPREALDALHAAIRADREASLGHHIRLVKSDLKLVGLNKDYGVFADLSAIMHECWTLPTGLEPDD